MATDFFLDIKEVPGESQDDKFKGQIEIHSWSFGESQTTSVGNTTGLGAGKVNMQDLHVTMHTSKAMPKFFVLCAQGTHIPKMVLSCRKAGGKGPVTYMKVSLSDCMVTTLQCGGSSGSAELPIDQMSFAFSKVEIEFTPQKADGSADSPVKGGWDLKLNKPV